MAHALREQIVSRIHDMVEHESLTKRNTRYRVIGEQLHVMVNNGLKCRSEEIPAIDLLTFDYDQLNDYQLPIIFELIVARHYTQR